MRLSLGPSVTIVWQTPNPDWTQPSISFIASSRAAEHRSTRENQWMMWVTIKSVSKHPGQLAIHCCVMIFSEHFFPFCHFQQWSLLHTSKREKDTIWWKVPHIYYAKFTCFTTCKPMFSCLFLLQWRKYPFWYQRSINSYFLKDLAWSFNLFLSCSLKPYLST